jgi:hypothetical protein
MEFGDDDLDESAKWRDPKYKGQLYTQKKPDYNDSREYDNARWYPKPKGYKGRKEPIAGGEFPRTDPLVKGFGRYGVGEPVSKGPRKGLPSRDQITSLKQSIKDISGKHTRANLPEMDKSQTPPGRDGSNDSDAGKKEYTAKTITPKKAAKDGEKILNKVLNKKQGVAEAKPVTIGSKLPKSDTATFGIEPGRGYKVNTPKDWKPGDRPRAIQQLIPTQDKKDHIRSRLGQHRAPVLPEQGVAEAGRYGSRNPDTMSPGDYDRYQQDQMDQGRRAFKRQELGQELAGEEEAYRREMSGTWYIRINGKILKDKQGQPFTFRGKAAANRAAVTMMAKPFNAGKQFTLTTTAADRV